MDARLYQMEMNLQKEIENIMLQKIKLLGDFQTYAKEKYTKIGEPFEIRHSSMNGESDTKYSDLTLGDDMCLKIVSFEYDPKSNMVNNHTTKIYTGKKIMEDFIQNLACPGNSYEGKIKDPHPLEKTESNDKERIEIEKQNKIKELLMRIFSGELVFNDTEYKRLFVTNIALEQELDRLNTRLSALQIVNGGHIPTVNDSSKQL